MEPKYYDSRQFAPLTNTQLKAAVVDMAELILLVRKEIAAGEVIDAAHRHAEWCANTDRWNWIMGVCIGKI